MSEQQNSKSKLSDETVLEQSRQSGMSYNEAKEFIARTSGGHGTSIYSDTNAEEVKRKNQESFRKNENDRSSF